MMAVDPDTKSFLFGNFGNVFSRFLCQKSIGKTISFPEGYQEKSGKVTFFRKS